MPTKICWRKLIVGSICEIHRSIVVSVMQRMLCLFMFLGMGLQMSIAQDDSLLAGKTVIVPVTLDDLADTKRIREWEQILAAAEEEKAKALVFDLNVKGELSWNLQERIMESLAKIKIPTVTFVNSSATGAGALIAIGSEKIYMAESGIIGGMGVRPTDTENEEVQKRELDRQVSLLKARARSIANLRGHRADVVEAFIDSDLEIKIGENIVSPKGEILTLIASEAVMEDAGKPLLATATAPDINTVLEKEGLAEESVRFAPGAFVRESNRTRLQSKNAEKKVKEDTKAAEDDSVLFTKRSGESYKGKIIVIKVGMDDLSTGKARFEFMDRTIKKAQLDGANAVIFDIDTPGGYAWYTQGLVLNSLQSVSIPTYAFVNTRAESAGAIVAIGTDHIYMRPAATIGSALVVTGTGGDLNSAMESKTTQMIISVVRNMAELKGHNPDIAEAFVTRKKSVKVDGTVIHEEGEVLNLNTIEATETINGRPVLAKGVANDLEDLVKQEELSGEIIEAETLGMEQFAHWLPKNSGLFC